MTGGRRPSELPPAPPAPAPLDLEAVRVFPTPSARLASADRQAALVGPEDTAADFLRSLPRYLAVERLDALARAIVEARRDGRHVVWALGAHVIKVGCAPLVVDLMERRVVTAVALNGAGAIHDYELSALGRTSEEVARTIRDGTFGFAEEAAAFHRRALARAASKGLGLGRAMGEVLLEEGAPHPGLGLLAAGARLGLPVTVHPALGTDTVHMHPGLDAAALGEAALTDFRILAAVVRDLEGGVWANVGSAVILPEVFLKAVSIARNLGRPLAEVTTANLDMVQHYRPGANVTGRPVDRGLELTGHHEILLPLLRLAILEGLRQPS
ncbi:MAG: hypothetical protein HY722_16590 [Planctomycetes bacterium]|nr:hypothetical protein [Planctomycetota bacterium]